MPSTAAPAAGTESRAPEPAAPAVAPSPRYITKDLLFSAALPEVTEEVDFPGWGTFIVGEINQADKDEIDHLAKTRVMGADGKEKEATDYRLFIPRLVCCALRNADGSPMFPDWKEQAEKFARKLSPARMDALFTAAAKVNAMTREAREALGKA